MNDIIWIQSENPIEQLWLYLSSLESIELAKKFISKRAEKNSILLSEENLHKKAIGTAYCLRNAREYLRPPSIEWNKRILNTYYGLMSIIEAILVADPKTDYDLERLEQATKMGHGLNNIDDNASEFPKSQKIYVTNDGLFVRYLSYLDVDTSSIKMQDRVKSISDLPTNKGVSVDELLARIPEISSLYFEMTGRMPLCAGVYKDDNYSQEKKAESPQFSNIDVDFEETWLRLSFPSSPNLEFLEKELCIGLENYHTYTRKEHDFWVGKIRHKKTESWEKSMTLHKSPMANSYWIKPVMGSIKDYLPISYMLLYVLSILVRYRPKIWREISEGSLDNYFAVIKYHIEAVSRALPQIALERVSGKEVYVSQPDGFAPEHYY